MNRFFLWLGLLFIGNITEAQTVADAIRYSRIQAGGTARMLSTGGALGALGGDFGVLSINPAGIATYRKSILVVTPSFNTIETTSTFSNNTTDDSETKFNLNNIGIVFARTKKESDWKSVNFAIGTNRLTFNNQSVFYQGETNGTIAERWVELSNGLIPDELYAFEEGLAFDAGVIFNPFTNDSTTYESDLGANDPVQKQQAIIRSGSINDVVIAFGGNYRHKLYVGLAVGLPFVTYDEEKTYTETDAQNINTIFNSMEYEETLQTTGVGINVKLGLIYRMAQNIRLGLAVHSPTYMNLSDQFFTTLTSNLTLNGQTLQTPVESPISNFSYKLNTPWRVVASGAFLLGKTGFVSGEIEYVDYSQNKFVFESPNDAQFEQELNNDIANTLATSGLNIRLGGELRYRVFAVRGGYAIYSTPYASGVVSEGETIQNISLGIGLREKRFFLDIGAVRSSYSELYSPYTSPNSNTQVTVSNDVVLTKFVASLGIRF